MFDFHKVSPPNGKSFLHVTGIAQDKLGYMWFSTKRGLFRYNGYDMINYKYDALDRNSIPSDILETITIDSGGNVWVGSLGSGLFKFDPVRQVFTRYKHIDSNKNTVSSDWISTVLSDSKGNIWVGTGNGLDRFDAKTNSFIHYTSNESDPTTLSSNEVVALYEDRKGVLWIGTGSIYGVHKMEPEVGGLNRMDDISGKFTRYKHNSSDPATIINNKVHAMYESRDGTFWVGTAGDGLHTLDRKTGKFRRYTNHPDPRIQEGLSRPPVTKDEFGMISFITEDVKGGIWIGTTDNGMKYYDPKTRRSMHFFPGTEAPTLSSNANPWATCTSAEGVLWFSSISGSLYTYDPLQIKLPFFQTEGGELSGFYEAKDHTLWAASTGSGLYHFDQDKNKINLYQHEEANPNSLPSNLLLALTADHNEDLWVGTVGEGVAYFDRTTHSSKKYKRIRGNENSLSNDTVIRVYEDPSGNIWAGTFYGLNLLNKKNGTFKRFFMYPGDTASFGRNLISAIFQDRSQRMWIGSFVGGGLHLFNHEEGTHKTYLQGVSISQVVQDTEGKIWAGAVEGLFYYDNNVDSFLRFNDPLGLTQIADVKSVVEDNDRNLWVATANSIRKISADRGLVTTYDNHFGLEADFTYGESHKGYGGNIYFPGVTGFYELNPRKFNNESKAPQIILSNFRISNQAVLPTEKGPLHKDIAVTDYIKLSYDQNIFSFDFASIDFVDPSANRHLFKLENYDRSWNVPGFDRKAIYFNVPPGTYVFRVKAVNAYGKWTEKAITIEIVPAWWSQWWFRILAIVAAVAIIYYLIRWRLNEKYRLQMERSEKEKELSRLQHRTSQLEMHALRAQMNPHFLFNSLNSINRFIIQNNSDQASGYLTKFSRLMRLILQNSQHELIPLENELEALKLYLELEAVRFDHHFTYAIKIDENLDVGALKVPPLIIQPYAENAIWHGLMHKEEKGKLLIELREEGDYLVCSIIDDGIGRSKAAELKSKSASTHKSMGMKITADRIASMKQRKSNENNIQITDLVLPDGSPAGTKVEIKIALQYD